MDIWELKGVELLVFTDNLVFESVFYKEKSKSPLLFEIVLLLHQVNMRGELILHIIHITGTRMIEARIDDIYRGINLGVTMRGLKTFQFVPLDQEAVVRLAKLEPWIRTSWGDSLSGLSTKYWFEHKGDNLLWDPPLAASETALDILLESRLQKPYKSHLMVVPRIMIFYWRKQMGKEADLLFNVPIGMSCWELGKHEPLIIILILPIFSRRHWKGPWTIRGSDCRRGAVRDLEIECK